MTGPLPYPRGAIFYPSGLWGAKKRSIFVRRSGVFSGFSYLCPMTTIRLTKEFSFEAAHALEGYDGPCREIHGHSYRLFVTVKGHPVEDPSDPKYGMVMDFGVLKRIVNEEIIAQLDHALVLRATPQGAPWREALRERFCNIVTVDYQPTCENMLDDFARRIARRLPAGVSLHALRLHETATSYAEWLAEDNL